ncbi:Winged helix-turn-helix transcription repressor DNA-binding [Penicillium taxi]|uniref:Winged helix-turn-helix transcription repressor DNA-binding n=1 Tax=Penicillium taxi TaxID=168475 RepID=UPI002545BC1F|nr:Winged helix-turn-helix transcription repressor DNA-binding [Penicillium taxi]KAJ5893890.1 Winged helix-turn-helix transcription repressor DNA-binding [Penicillium taxi]
MSSEMPSFSYAQAAKGVSGSHTTIQTAPIEPEKTDSKSEELPKQATEKAHAAPEAETQQTNKDVSNVKEAGFTTVTSKHVRSKVVHPRASSSSVRSSATQSKEGDSSNAPNGKEDSSTDKSQSDAKTKSENGSVSSKGKSEKEKTAPPKELKAAPLPSVNIWQQRQQAQDAKSKTVPVTAKSVSGKNTEEVQQDLHKGGKKKSATDGASENPKDRKKSEPAKARDESLPLVEDASLWPTPEVATGEEKKKAQEKPLKTETTDKSPSRSHGKEKWMPVNYVPNAVFSTPLPTSGGRGARRGGRGGRDGGRGGSHAATAEKNASAQASHAAGAKHVSGDRGPTESGNNRAASIPAQSGRSASADINASEGRKAGRGPRGTDETTTNGKQANGGENVAHSQRDGKQYSKNESRNQKPNVAVDPARANNYARTQSNSKSADPTRESAGFQDFGRERGDVRAERGGRGGNRGRGGSYNFHQNGQQISNGYVPKSFNYSERQRSHGSIPNGSHQGNRMSIRSPSLPASGNIYQNNYGYNNDLMYGVSPVTPGPVTYPQQYVEPYSLMNMLSMQLDYYFSVDNLCKDMFLRKHMDSQGFVPLVVIANFKRVKSLTEDIELIRHVTRHLRNAEYQTGEDGIERLRPREKWETWVLALELRDDAAKHGGVAPAQSHDENAIPNGSSLHPGSQQFIPNGISHNPRAHLSTAAPEFLPSYAQNEIVDVRKHSFDPWESSDSRGSLPISRHELSTKNSSKSNRNPARGLNSQNPQAFAARTTSTDSAKHQFNRKINVQKVHEHSTTSSSRRNEDRNRKSTGEKYFYNQRKRTNKKIAEDFASETHWNNIGGSTHRYVLLAKDLAFQFDMHLYNDLRRSALDELLTRHVPDAFEILMSFYAGVFETDQDIPIQVFSDLAHLAYSDLNIEYCSAARAVMQNVVAHGRIFDKNKLKAELYFGFEYSMQIVQARDERTDQNLF